MYVSIKAVRLRIKTVTYFKHPIVIFTRVLIHDAIAIYDAALAKVTTGAWNQNGFQSNKYEKRISCNSVSPKIFIN